MVEVEEESACDDSVIAEIDALLNKRAEFRRIGDWASSDEIKRVLSIEPYRVEISDFADKPSRWDSIGTEKRISIAWSSAQHTRVLTESLVLSSLGFDGSCSSVKLNCCRALRLVIATVNSPRYRDRLSDTLSHLRERGCCPRDDSLHGDCLRFRPQPYDLIDLSENPSLGAKRVLIEGWRTVLLPWILSQEQFCTDSFLLIAEDDIRIPSGISIDHVHRKCAAAFKANPDLDILSLGHSWKALSKQQRTTDLLKHLRGGGGVHGTTLLAVRFPEGVRRLRLELDRSASRKKQTHFDQYLFFSAHHNLALALSDPPLVGWAEVTVTLTQSGSGHRRHGGGRREFQPPKGNGEICWVRRCLVVEEEES